MRDRDYQIQWKKVLKAVSPAHIRRGIRYLKKHGARQFAVRMTERFRPEEIDYKTWFSLNRAKPKTLEEQRQTEFADPVTISVLVPAYCTPVKFLRAMIESVEAQTYPHWELCIVDASPAKEENGHRRTALTQTIREYSRKDPRIRCRILKKNGGIAQNLNAAIAMAKGEFVSFLDHDDLLEPDALYELARLIREDASTDMVYTDEDKVDRKGKHFSLPNMKPDFNLDLLRSNNYICHFLAVRTALAREAGGFRPEFDGAQDYDFIFRCAEKARKIAHVHRVLYHWRTHELSTSDNPDSKEYAFLAGKRAVEAHLARVQVDAEVLETPDPGYFRVKYALQGEPLVSVIIPNKDEKETLRTCLSSIWEKTEYENYEILVVENNSTTQEIFDYYQEIDGRNHVRVLRWEGEFNYSAINNFAARQAKGEYLLLLNNDVQVITKGWMKEMLSHCQRKEVAMVGAKLYYPDDTVQSAGTVIGMLGLAGHAFSNMPRQQSGYMHRASIQMDVSGTTAACAMIKRKVYEQVGGLEEKLKVAFNDVDLGLKIVSAGYLIVYDPYAELYHYESKSRGSADGLSERHLREVEFAQKKWADFLEKGDPCYNRNLSLRKQDYSLRI